MISLDQYWAGRDGLYSHDLTYGVSSNADILLKRVNALLPLAAKDQVLLGINGRTGTAVTSGWRPRALNDATDNAAKNSNHIIGCAIDLTDTLPQRPFARWCLCNQNFLAHIGLWMEDPRWTPTWVHLQSVPPTSGSRVFIPSKSRPLTAALPEQDT